MGSMGDDREPQPEPRGTREPLVDLDVRLPQPNEPPKGSRPRRKRLSDIETEAAEAQPQPQVKPPCRPSLASSGSGSSEPQFVLPSLSEPRRSRLAEAAPAPEGQELRPRAGHLRIAMTLSSEEVPGLQNILDPPRLSNEGSVSGQTMAEQLTNPSRRKQHFSLALAGGLAAAAAGAAVWALMAVAVSPRIGWLAMGVGLLVGAAVRVLGRGTDRSFGYLGAAMSILGCLMGNLLGVCMVVAGQEGLAPLAVLSYLCRDPVLIPAAMIATFRSIDLLFYGIAIYEGYRLSFRRVPDAEGNPIACRN
jgi:hypothetical protein